jgi:hypothetical protein
MKLYDIRLTVNELKEAQERGSRNAAAMELFLLWAFVGSIAQKACRELSEMAEYMMSSGIKSVDRKDLAGDLFWRRPYESVAEFKDAVMNG